MSQPHISKDALAPMVLDDYEGRSTEIGGGFTVAFESMPALFPPVPEAIWAGLPDDHCQCPHWGYVFKGSFRAMLTDGSEYVVSAGEAYHLPPGHRIQTIEPVELIEFSPKEELARTMEQIMRNVAAMEAEGAAAT
jgi:hypothetical protein